MGWLDKFPTDWRDDIVRYFKAKINIDDNDKCWSWLGGKDHNGYGLFGVKRCGIRRTIKAHRLSYEIFCGPFDKILTIDHKCVNKGCVNPHHLDLVSSRENTMRCQYAPATINFYKTHCKHGHEFNEKNTYIYSSGSRMGQRKCRECNRLYAKTKQWPG
jgi:HNH endonuclease